MAPLASAATARARPDKAHGAQTGLNNIAPVTLPRLGQPRAEGLVCQIHSPEEFDAVLEANPDKLVVLMCKAMGCRPCKMFSRKYHRIAANYPDAIFAEIFGDETKTTRQMMIRMQVKVTPTFRLYRNHECVHSHGGINEGNLISAITEHINGGAPATEEQGAQEGATPV